MEHRSMEYSSRQRYWVLEIKLMSCKDLKAFNFFQKLSVYAIVSLKVISDDAEKKVKEAEEQMNEEVVEQQIKKTPTDGEGDGNPEWNHEMRFEFDHNDDHRQLKDGRLLIHFDLRHQGLGILGIGDRSIGEVRVPLNDLMIPYIPPSPANNSGLGLGLGGVQQQQQQARYDDHRQLKDGRLLIQRLTISSRPGPKSSRPSAPTSSFVEFHQSRCSPTSRPTKPSWKPSAAPPSFTSSTSTSASVASTLP